MNQACISDSGIITLSFYHHLSLQVLPCLLLPRLLLLTWLLLIII
jgi:hypothetical protein